jgi:hypothetical protein
MDQVNSIIYDWEKLRGNVGILQVNEIKYYVSQQQLLSQQGVKSGLKIKYSSEFSLEMTDLFL